MEGCGSDSAVGRKEKHQLSHLKEKVPTTNGRKTRNLISGKDCGFVQFESLACTPYSTAFDLSH